MDNTKIKKINLISIGKGLSHRIPHLYPAAYSVITMIQACIRLLVFLVVAELLGPEKYATWPLVQAIMSYNMLIGLGVMPALGLELPICKGAGRDRKYNLILGSSFIFLVLFWVVGVFVVTAIILNNYENRFYAYGGALALLQSIIQFFLKIHRSNLDFRRLFWSIFFSVVFLPFGLFLVFRTPSLELFCIVFAISLIIQLCLLFDFKSLKAAKFKGYWFTLKIVCYLQRIGVPLLASVALITFLFSIDRWFVNYFYSQILLGQYGFAVFAAMGIQLLITSVGQVYYPTIAHGYGASNKLSCQKKNIVLFLVLTLSLVLGLILTVWFLMPAIVIRCLPDYQEGLKAAKWMVLGGAALPFATLASILLRVKKILWPLVIGQAIGICFAIVVIYVGCQFGTLQSVGVSVALSYVLFSICVVCVAVICFWPYFSTKIPILYSSAN